MVLNLVVEGNNFSCPADAYPEYLEVLWANCLQSMCFLLKTNVKCLSPFSSHLSNREGRSLMKSYLHPLQTLQQKVPGREDSGMLKR